MARPRNNRLVERLPDSTYFKPRAIPLSVLEEVVLTYGEVEAVRLVDFEGMYQDKAAAKMGLSRQSLGRMLKEARKKVADALVNGKAIKIEGGNYELIEKLMGGDGGGRRC